MATAPDAAAATAAQITTAAAAAAAPGAVGQHTVLPFGGNDVLGQLNVWAATITTQIADLGAGLAGANGRAILLAQEVETKNAETQENLRQVMTAGASALNATIDGFRIELGKHEYAHNLARSQIEAVVAGAERKFQENHDIAGRDAHALYDGFSAECARRDADDAKRLGRQQEAGPGGAA